MDSILLETADARAEFNQLRRDALIRVLLENGASGVQATACADLERDGGEHGHVVGRPVLGRANGVPISEDADLSDSRHDAVLRQDGGDGVVHVVDPAEGDLACGYEGIGRLAPVEEILARVAAVFSGKA